MKVQRPARPTARRRGSESIGRRAFRAYVAWRRRARLRPLSKTSCHSRGRGSRPSSVLVDLSQNGPMPPAHPSPDVPMTHAISAPSRYDARAMFLPRTARRAAPERSEGMTDLRAEPASPPQYRTADQPRLRLLIPLVVACGLFMENLDSTILATAIPQMAQSLGESPLRLNVAITSYLLSLAVFIPVSGWVADRYGARSVFCTAIAVFTMGSALCGAATSLPMLVLTRILQGLGGAMMTPVGRLILLKSFPKSQLVTAMSYVTLPALVGPAIGPLVGGFLTTYATWRWIF